MKKFILVSALLLSSVYTEAKLAFPQGAEIDGAGSTIAADYINTLITKYNSIFPCPVIVYKQRPLGFYAGSLNGINRVLDRSVTFSVSDTQVPNAIAVDETLDCLLQIPFILSSLSIVYNLPADFGPSTAFPPNVNWPGHLNISPADLCTVYTSASALTWSALLGRHYNGVQTYGGTLAATAVKGFARSDSSDETGLFTLYLDCSNPSIPTTACNQYARSGNPNGPFCAPAVLTWGPNVQCVLGSKGIANAVATNRGTIGYVNSVIACSFGLPSAGLFIPGSTLFTSPQQNAQDNPANYTQPTTAAVQAADPTCAAGIFHCVLGAYPIVVGEMFVLFATQPDNLIACNTTQFIQFALTQGQKICGATPLPIGCINQSLMHLDQIRSVICDPCLEPCNPCLNQTCPLPTCLPCKL